jgi:hypothetical protein
MYVTLNISPSGVRLLAAEGRKVRRWGSLPLPPGLVKDGLITRPKVVGAVIDALFKSTAIPKRQVIVSLTGLPFIHRTLSLPRLERTSRAEAVRRAARKEMPLPLEELYLSAQAIGERPDEMEFFVLGVPRQAVDALMTTLAGAGISPYLVELNPLALARVANRAEALIVDLEPGSFDIVLVANGLPVIMRTITPGGGGATAEDNIRRLAAELARTVEFYNSNHPQNPLSPTLPLLLTGEMVTEASTELIRAGTGYPVEMLMPPWELPADLPVASFTANIGLALKRVSLRGEARYHDINLNIISDRFREGPRYFKLPHLVLSLVALIGLGLLPYIYQLKSQAGAEVMRGQTELGRVDQELAGAQRSAEEAEQLETNIDKLLAGAAAVEQEHRSILGRGGDYAANLKLVTSALPEGANFTSMEMDVSQITVAGGAPGPFAVVDYVMALEATGGFAEVRIDRIDEGKSGVAFVVAISR